MKQQGFTLIEVLIAMGILATLSVLTAQSISRSIRDKSRMQTNIDNISSIETAFKIIERDIQMTFHFKDIHHELLTKLGNNKKQNANPPLQRPPTAVTQPQQAHGAIPPPQTTQFLGEESRINFVTLLQGRGYSKGLDGDIKEVGYYIEECKGFIKRNETSDCLWRRIASFVDDDVERGGAARVLLENVKLLEFRFYNGERKSWDSVWNSKTQNTFPRAVEITLEVENNKRPPIKRQSVIPLRHTHNPNVNNKAPVQQLGL